MKILLVASVFFMDPETRKVRLLWQDIVPQESIESCMKAAADYKYEIEISPSIEVRAVCVPERPN